MGFESFPTIESKNDINFLGDEKLSSQHLEESKEKSTIEEIGDVENEERHPSLDDLIEAAKQRRESHFGISRADIDKKAPDAKNMVFDDREVEGISPKYGSIIRKPEKIRKTRPDDGETYDSSGQAS